MRRHNQSDSHHGGVAVDDSIPRGFSRGSYTLKGFNTAHNPTVPPAGNGLRPAQNELNIIFESGLKRHADGVAVEDVLNVCVDHLGSKMATIQGNERHARAAGYIRAAMNELRSSQNGYDQEGAPQL